MHDDSLLLQDILEAGEKILRYTNGLAYYDFMADEKAMDAVVRNFEIIGEASGRISEAFQQKFPSMEWRKAAQHQVEKCCGLKPMAVALSV